MNINESLNRSPKTRQNNGLTHSHGLLLTGRNIMSIDSDLQVLQHHLNKKREVDASLVISLQQSILQKKALVIWPWLIESSIWQLE